MLHFLVAMVAAASAVSAFEFGGGTCSGTAANPSVYNFQIGEYPAKVISDGQLMFPSSEGVFAVDPSLVTRALETNFQSTDPIIFQMNVLYVEWGDDRILFDTGFGFGNNETAGWLLNQLETEGISRDSITKVLISHGHLDHVSGLIVDPESGAAFPNAEVYISQEDLDFWANPTFENDLPAEFTDTFAPTFEIIFDQVKDKVRAFPAGEGEVIPGITTFLCPYQSPGHVAYTLSPPEGDPLVYVGDCIGDESTAINNQFEFLFDTFQADGPSGRVAVLEQLAKDRVKALVYHDAFPGLGYVTTNDNTFDFKRANYEPSEAVKTMCPM